MMNDADGSDSLVQRIIEAAPMPMLVVDLDQGSRIEVMSRRFGEVFGYSSAEVRDVATWWPRAYPDPAYRAEVQAAWEASIAAAAREGRSSIHPVEAWVTCRDGRRVFVEAHMGMVGNVGLVVLDDLSRRRAIELALEDARSFLQQLVDSSPNLISVVDADSQLRFANCAFGEFHGQRVAELLAPRDAQAPVGARDPAASDTDNREVLTTLAKLERDQLATNARGEPRWFHTVKVPLRRQDGTRDVLTIATDITERKRVESALRESEERLRMTLAAADMGLWDWDVTTNQVTWDATLCRIWGYTSDDYPKTYADYLNGVHPAYRDKVAAVVKQVLETGAYPPLEHKLVRPDGTERWIAARATVVRDEDGQVAKLIGGAVDITDKIREDERVRESQKLAAVGQLSAGVAHNFNNMLLGILLNLELALPGVPPKTAELLTAAKDSALRAAELVRQLMTFAGGASARPRRPDDVNSILERTIAMCRRVFDRRIELVVEGQPDAIVLASADLEQAFLDVLINARDALAECDQPRVTVTVSSVRATAELVTAHGLERGRDYACVSIHDNGPGMSAAERVRIFEPFFTTKAVGAGTGLGLSTALTITKEHGGAIACESAPGTGTTFRFYLPTAEPPPCEAPANAEPTPAGGHEGILVVDDETLVRQAVTRLLEAEGYKVFSAPSGAEALRLLDDAQASDDIGLVLLDMSMPGMTGAQVRNELKRSFPRLRVAYFSGYLLDGADDVEAVIAKPIQATHLLETVRKLLDRAQT